MDDNVAMSKYRPCKRGESPRPKKSGYSPSTREAISDGTLRYNKTGKCWEKLAKER